MTATAQTVQRTYLVLTLLTTLASSFIWGINTLFLLDAGLSTPSTQPTSTVLSSRSSGGPRR